jgi:hypothetical protein
MTILRRLPFFEGVKTIAVPDGLESAKPYQIIITVSLAPRQVVRLEQGAPRF